MGGISSLPSVRVRQTFLGLILTAENSGTVIPLCDFTCKTMDLSVYKGVRGMFASRSAPMGAHRRRRTCACTIEAQHP